MDWTIICGGTALSVPWTWPHGAFDHWHLVQNIVFGRGSVATIQQTIQEEAALAAHVILQQRPSEV